MSGPPKIPNLPLFFGNDSPFPPMMPTPRQVSSGDRFNGVQQTNNQRSNQHSPMPPQSRPVPPPLPPSRNEALQREQMIRQQQQHQQAAALQYQNQRPMMMNGGARPQMAPPVQPMPQSITPRPKSPPIPQPSHFQSFNQVQRPINMPRPIPAAPSPAPSSYRQPQQSNQSGANLSNSMNSMNITGNGSSSSSYQKSTRESFSSGSDSSSLNVILPDLDELVRRRDVAFASQDERQKAGWCKEVFKYVERKLDGNRISDPSLIQMIDQAINTINRSAATQPPLAEALYLRGDLLASGSFPSYFQKDLRAAFNDFELSARMGYAPSWFRIGRDYEVLGDMARSRDAYERGCSVQDIGCIYRMGMANLLGQLELGIDHGRAIPLLKEAADLANLDTPQPSYVFGMLLAGEFSHVRVSNEILNASVDSQRRPSAGTQRENEARRRIQKAAYLNFAPAQFRMGYLHEYAQLECPFDPLLSVQYYSLASQGGEVEADLALSKWFLCGAENCFDKNESLAFTFADKAAAKGLPTAEFAMAYYFEIGVGCEKDLDVARKWYKRAASHGSKDAQERLDALAGPEPNALSRTQHEVHIDTKLQRKRTEAKMISDRRTGKNATVKQPPPINPAGAVSAPSESQNAQHKPTQPPPNRDLRRKQTMRMVEEVAGNRRQMGQSVDSRTTTPVPISTNNKVVSASPSRNPAANQQRPPPPPGTPGRGTSNQTPFQSPSGGPRRGSGPGSVPFRPVPTSGMQVPNAASSNLPVKSAASMGSDKKVYETFDEMGIASQSAKDEKDCLIM